MELIRLLPLVAALAFVGCGSNDDSGAPDLGLQAQIGFEFVQQRGCMTCHGGDAATAMSGSTTPVANSQAYPANLTPDTATGIGGWADIEIVRAMRFGIDDEQAALCPTMPRFDGSDPMRPFMTDVEATAIIAYLRSLKPIANHIPESMCPPVKPRPAVDMAAPPSVDDMTTTVEHD